MIYNRFPNQDPLEPAEFVQLELQWQTAIVQLMNEFSNFAQCGDRLLKYISTLHPSIQQKLILGKAAHLEEFKKTLKLAKEQVIIVNPWLNRNVFDEEIISLFTLALNRNVQIYLGWGWHHDIGNIIIPGNGCWSFNPSNTWKYNAMSKLQAIRRQYQKQFHLKLIGTHAKFWVCDRKFAVVGSANILCSKPRDVDKAHTEVGLQTTNLNEINSLIRCFQSTPNLAANSALKH